ncbi:MAG TPA: hypothetical protein VF233_10700 [Nitrososphaeraceae archaeon]
MFIVPIIKILQQSIIVVTAVTIVMGISTLAMMMIPQTAAYATQDDDCDSDQSPASIDGRTRCIGEGECESYEFAGKEVKHCNY